MDQNTTDTTAPDVMTLGGQMAQATQSLAEALKNLDGQFAAVHAKIDRIVAAIEDGELQAGASANCGSSNKVAELEKQNQALKAQSASARRKTLSPMVTALLAKEGVAEETVVEGSIVDKALTGLSIEQRIAVKAELARAGILA
jgi:hypothetical protein